MKKVDPNFVRSFFQKEGYELLSDYKGANVPVKFRCPENHEHQIPFRRFREGKRCRFCVEARRVSPQKLTQSFVEAQLELSGYKMLSDYINTKTKFSFCCPEKHLGQMTWSVFLRGGRCRACSYINNGIKKKIDVDVVKNIFQKEGYEVLGEYVGAHSPISFRCPEGHLGKIVLHSFKSGARCMTCWKARQGQARALGHNFVVKNFNAEGYEVLSKYVKAILDLDVVCPNKHRISMSWNHFQQGGRCKFCSREKTANSQRLSHDFVVDQFALEGC